MFKLSILFISLLFVSNAYAISGSWDFRYTSLYCDMSVTDSFHTDDNSQFGYTVSFSFIGKNHVNAKKIKTNALILHVSPNILPTFGEHLKAEQLSLNGLPMNQALSYGTYTSDKVDGILDDLLQGKPVAGLAKFIDGTVIKWNINTKDIDTSGSLFRLCVKKSK